MVCTNCETHGSTLIFTCYKFFHNQRWREILWALGVTEEIFSALLKELGLLIFRKIVSIMLLCKEKTLL